MTKWYNNNVKIRRREIKYIELFSTNSVFRLYFHSMNFPVLLIKNVHKCFGIHNSLSVILYCYIFRGYVITVQEFAGDKIEP